MTSGLNIVLLILSAGLTHSGVFILLLTPATKLNPFFCTLTAPVLLKLTHKLSQYIVVMFCNFLDAQLVTSIENKMNISNTSKKGEVLCTGNNKCVIHACACTCR